MAAFGDVLEGALGSDQEGADAFFPGTYLDSPILLTPRVQYLTEKDRLWPEYTKNIKRLPKSDYNKLTTAGKATWALMQDTPDIDRYEMVDPDEYPSLIHYNPGDTTFENLEASLDIASDIFDLCVDACDTWINPNIANAQMDCGEGSRHMRDFSRQLSQDEHYYYKRWGFWNNIVEHVASECIKRKPKLVKQTTKNGSVIRTNLEMVLISLRHDSGTTTQKLLTYDQLLMFKDLLYVRAQVLTACRVLYPQSSQLQRHVKKLFLWQESCLQRYSNAGYEVLKNTESLSKAYLSIISGDTFGDDGPFGRMIEKIKAKEDKCGATEEKGYLVDEFVEVLKTVDSVAHVVELFGLQKMTGHPLIDPTLGGLSAAEQARSPDQTTLLSASRISWNFSRMFLENYVPIHGWPAMTFTDKSTRLYKLYSLQKRSFHRSEYDLSDWSSCKINRVFEFDYAPNYLELMDDKAISQYRSNIASNWDKRIPATSHRRLLLEMISREEISAKQIVHAVMRREIPFDWLIVCLYPKERELKIAPRMFSMLVFEMRLFFTLTESNIADNIFKYLPQQTMTKSRLETSKMFLDLTRPVVDDDTLHMFVEIDLSRWNLRWRELTVHLTGDVCDSLFDTPGVFTFAHEFFSQSMIVVRVRNLVPDHIDQDNPRESDLLWYDHSGGFEGLCQKLWTICTYAMIDLAMDGLPVSYRLIGQGDNQILSIRFRRNRSISIKEQLIAMRDLVLSRVLAECTKVNQEVKPEECLESTSVITYSKDVYVDGVYYPTSLKFHSRLFPHSSQDFPSVRTNLGAIFSTSLAGAEKSPIPLRSYYLALVQAGGYLLRILDNMGIYGSWFSSILKRSRHVDKRSLVKFLLLLPSELGGYPITPFVHFIYKAGSDPLSKSVASLVLLRATNKDRLVDRMLSQLELQRLYTTTGSTLSLLRDPYCLPFNKPPTPIDGVTSLTVAGIRPQIRTKAIEELLRDDSLAYAEELAQIMGKVSPFNPLMLRDVLECSAYGISDTIGKMFVATRTMQGVARMTDECIIPTVLKLELDNFSYLVDRFTTIPSSPWVPKTIYETVKLLRGTWKLSNVPIPEGITTFSPFDTRVKFGAQTLNDTGLHALLTTSPTKAGTTRGPYDPYVGSKTKEKRSEHGYKIVSSDTTSEAFRKLQMIASQTGDNRKFKELLDSVGFSRSNTRLSSISHLLTSVSGGTLAHRYAARAGYQESYGMGSPNFATHCLISSDNSGKLSGGIYDYPLMFQEYFLSLLWILQYVAACPDVGMRCVMFCTENLPLEPLPDSTVTLDWEQAIPIKRFVNNPLAFIDRLQLQRIGGGGVPTRLTAIKTIDRLVISSDTDRKRILEAWFRTTLRENGVARRAADSNTDLFMTGSLDIAEIVSNGLKNLIEASSSAIVDEYVLDSYRTIDSSVSRWRDTAFITKTSVAIASTFTYAIGHPLLRKDEAVIQHKLYDVPTYTSRSGEAHSKVASLITQRAIDKLHRGDEGFFLRTLLVFASAGGNRSLEAVLTCIFRVLMLGVTSSLITAHERGALTSKLILPVIRMPHDETVKLTALDICLRDMVAHLRKRNSHYLADLVMTVINGDSIQYMSISASEAVRLTRNIDIANDVVISNTNIRKPTSLADLNLIPDTFDFSTTIQCDTDPDRSAVPLTEDRQPWKQYALSRIVRHACGNYRPGITAFNLWKEFSSLLRDNNVMVVGVGYGGAAACAIESGATHVEGLDLRSSLPLKPHRYTTYVPPLVAEYNGYGMYTQNAASIITDGDWFNPETSSYFLKSDPGSSTVIVDIEGGEVRHAHNLLKPLIGHKTQGVYLIRMYLTDRETQQLGCDLHLSRCNFRIYTIDWLNHVRLRVLLIRHGIEKLVPCKTLYKHTSCQLNQSPQLTTPLCLQEYLECITRYTMPYHEVKTIQEACIIYGWYLASLHGEYVTRLGYRRWTDVLIASISLVWAASSLKTRIELLEKWKQDKLAQVTLGDLRLSLNYSRTVETHLLTLVSGILNEEERSTLLRILSDGTNTTVL